MEAPISAQDNRSSMKAEARGSCEQSFSTKLDPGSQPLEPGEDSVVVSDTGATANLARFPWSDNRKLLLEKHGSPRVSTHPARARFKFGGGRLRGVRLAADITVGIAVCMKDVRGFCAGCGHFGVIAQGDVGSPGRPVGFLS